MSVKWSGALPGSALSREAAAADMGRAPVQRPPQVMVYGQPIGYVLTEFIGVPCSVCDHPVLTHRNLTGCHFGVCDCRRTPWDFR